MKALTELWDAYLEDQHKLLGDSFQYALNELPDGLPSFPDWCMTQGAQITVTRMRRIIDLSEHSIQVGCPKCNGRGKLQPDYMSSQADMCYVCNGTGKVQQKVERA